MRLTKLTDEQLALLPKQRDKWLKIGLSTEPLDFDKAKAAVVDAYRVAGLEPPKFFYRFQSPFSAALGATLLKSAAQVGDQVWAQVWAQVRAQVWAQVRDQVGAQVRDQVRAQVRDQVWAQVGAQVFGCHDAAWLSFHETFLLFGIDATKKLAPLMDLAKHCGWWAPYKNAAILQDRPVKIKFDDQNRLHCEDGPAVLYRDDFAVYSWHGTRVPREWIAEKTLDARTAIQWGNMEQRRAACEIVGWHNVLEQLNAKTIDSNPNPQIGDLLEVQIPDVGREKFLRVRCGTARTFALPVPPEMKTALESQAWLNFVTEADILALEVRT